MIEYVAIGLVLIAVVIILYQNPKKNTVLHHEADIRLPYKKYKELYPRTGYSYVDYKKMQTKEAF
ncbi:hypothetical protein FJY84_08965, partial [Candidatus Bathyarchaeota archaeon]|nr:hypothetical protein [Candidatus Bathyarchaeota archaeon]